MLEKWIAELTKEMGLSVPLPKESENIYLLPVDEGVTVIISELPGGFSFFCRLSSCPKEEKEEFFTQVMLANLFGQATKRAVLGLDDDCNFLTLSLEAPYHDYGDFRDQLEDFLNTVDFWIDEATEAKQATEK